MEHVEVQKVCECTECMIKTIHEMQYIQTIVLAVLFVFIVGGAIIYATK